MTPGSARTRSKSTWRTTMRRPWGCAGGCSASGGAGAGDGKRGGRREEGGGRCGTTFEAFWRRLRHGQCWPSACARRLRLALQEHPAVRCDAHNFSTSSTSGVNPTPAELPHLKVDVDHAKALGVGLAPLKVVPEGPGPVGRELHAVDGDGLAKLVQVGTMAVRFARGEAGSERQVRMDDAV